MTPLSLISAIRNSFIGSELVYTCGSCYQFYLILKEAFPEAEAYHDENHVITKIGENYYDITGEVQRENHEPIEPDSDVKTCKFKLL